MYESLSSHIAPEFRATRHTLWGLIQNGGDKLIVGPCHKQICTKSTSEGAVYLANLYDSNRKNIKSLSGRTLPGQEKYDRFVRILMLAKRDTQQ